MHARRTGLWLHADDLAPGVGPLAEFAPDSVAAFTSERTYRERYRLGKNRIHALRTVLADGVARATAHDRCRAALFDTDDTATGIVAWARSQQLTKSWPSHPTSARWPTLSRTLPHNSPRSISNSRASGAHPTRTPSPSRPPAYSPSGKK